jgi:apolipoprotein D and lipocalin family protein
MKNRIFFIFELLIFIAALSLSVSCVSMPSGAIAIKPFDANKYLGKWYEIARFDFAFEKGLNNTTAQYSLNKDGSINVLNQGYDYAKGKWTKAVGRAEFVGARDEAKLKVSFFGPFFAGYNVVALDSNYKYALVAGNSLDYLWILSREKTIPETVKKNYLEIADSLGYDLSKLIWVEQDKDNPNQ